MTHIDNYTRLEIVLCLKIAQLTHVDGAHIDSMGTEILRNYLSDAIATGDAPEIEVANE